MKKLATLLAVGLIAATLPASAQVPDGIGFYFDEAGTYNMLMSAPLYSQIPIYLLATHISRPGGISGWEAEIAIVPEPLFPPTYALNNDGINVMTAPIFQVGMAESLPYAPAIRLMTVSVLNFGTSFKLAIGPCTPSSFGGLRPGYADGIDPGLLVGLTPSALPYFIDRPYFSYVAEFMPGVPTTGASWSGVKSLYR